MVEQTTPDGRVAGDAGRPIRKTFLGFVAARLRNGRSSRAEAGTTGPDSWASGAKTLPVAPAARRSAVRSSMNVGITGGLTLFDPRNSGR